MRFRGALRPVVVRGGTLAKKRAATGARTGNSDVRQRCPNQRARPAYDRFVEERFHLFHDRKKAHASTGNQDCLCRRAVGMTRGPQPVGAGHCVDRRFVIAGERMALHHIEAVSGQKELQFFGDIGTVRGDNSHLFCPEMQ